METTMDSDARAWRKSPPQFGLRTFLRDERGMSTIEYIILMVVVVVGCVGVWNKIGDKVEKELKNSQVELETLGEE